MVGLAISMDAAPGRMALLLGSGLSLSAGIPTGWDVVTDLALKVAAAEGIDPLPSNPTSWYSSTFGVDPDYSKLLEAVAPTPAQRRDILSGYFEPSKDDDEAGQRQPTEAHRAIARMVKAGLVKVIVTTNFDRLLEQALVAVGTDPVVIASTDAAKGAPPLTHASCTIVKVHGDYLDPNIRNTIGELETYDDEMDQLLDRIFDEYGLLVCGWSGTWDRALRHAIERCPTRRYGFYWASVGDLGDEAKQLIRNRDGHIIRVDGADSLFTSLESKVAALRDIARRPALEGDLLIAEAKRYLPDPVHRIRLDDLFMAAASKGIEAITFDANPPASDCEHYLEEAHRIEAACVDLLAVCPVLGEYGSGADQESLVRRILTRLASPTSASLSGFTAWIELRGYPGLLASYALGLGAIHRQNWPILATALLTVTRESKLDGEESRAFSVFKSVKVLSGPCLNTTFEQGRKTPVSDYLFQLLSEHVRPQLQLSESEFEDLFDRWEYAAAVVQQAAGEWPALGRWTWRSHRTDTVPSSAIDSAVGSVEQAGFSLEHLTTIKTQIQDRASSQGLHW